MTTAPSGRAGSMTAEELFWRPDDGLRHELIEGELTTVPPVSAPHGRTVARVTHLVLNLLDKTGLGEGFTLRRDPDTVRAPDVAFIRAERVHEVAATGFPQMSPDLVAEVVSPSDRPGQVTAKALFWLEVGVRLVWVVDPDDQVVTVYRPGNVVELLQGEDALLSGEDVLPGFSVPLRATTFDKAS